MFHEIRLSLRTMLRRPFYPIVTTITLSLGLAACMAAFTYINGFFQPFPGVDASGLVRVLGVSPDEPSQNISYLDFLDYAEADGGAFEGLAASQPYFAASVRHESMTEVAFLEAVSGSFFDVLGLRPRLGRGITPDDDRPGAESVAVLSYGWWQRSFDADPEVVGSTVYLNFRPFTVVGVMGPDFHGTPSDFRPDVWIPIAPFKDRYVGWARRADNRDLPLVRVYARLNPGIRKQRAQDELASMAAGLDEVHPRQTTRRQLRIEKATWIDPGTRQNEWNTARVMMIAAGGLLLLVCANVANLLLSIATGRQHELTMRVALGASPWRLVRQVLIDSVLLSTIAGAIALALAVPASVRLGSYFARPSVWGANVAREASLDLRVIVFAFVVSVATGLVAGLLPAWRASRRNLTDTLKEGRDATVAGTPRVLGVRMPGLHDLLVTAQIGLAVVLLVVAGLVLRTFGSVRGLDPGFDYGRLLVTHISTSSTTLEPEERPAFFREVADRLSEEPWVRAATVADFPLLSPHPTVDLLLDGQTEPSSIVTSRVIPGFFAALDIDVIEGRGLGPGDVAGAPDVAIVNESLVREFFPGETAVGRRVNWPQGEEADRVYEIVGVVRDTKTRDYFAQPEPTVYVSYPQHAYPTGSALLVATQADPRGSVASLNRWLREFEPHLAIVNVVTYPDVVGGYLYTQRMNAELYSVLAFLGLGLAAVGVFSVMSLAVSRRTREIGIRMAIGARRRDIGQLVVRRSLVPVGLGLGLGLAASFAVKGLVASLLSGVEPTDPPTLLAGVAVLLTAALLATYLPARRASRVDPVIALRHD